MVSLKNLTSTTASTTSRAAVLIFLSKRTTESTKLTAVAETWGKTVIKPFACASFELFRVFQKSNS